MHYDIDPLNLLSDKTYCGLKKGRYVSSTNIINLINCPDCLKEMHRPNELNYNSNFNNEKNNLIMQNQDKCLWQYVIILHPTNSEKEKDEKPKIIVPLTTIYAVSQDSAGMLAALDIPEQYKQNVDRIQIALRPF